MKPNLRRVLPLLMGAAIFYSSCKKTDNSPATTKTQTSDQASAAIATNLVQSLSGAYGGASIKDGVSTSQNLSSASKIKTQSAIGCGFYTDKSLDLTFNQGDTLKSHATGSYTYFFLCKNNLTTGYNLTDTLTTTGSGPGYAFTFQVVQDYAVKGLNVNNSNFTLDGKLKSWVDFNYTKLKTSSSVHNTFTFSNLYVHADDNFDITSGTATFQSKGLTTTSSWDYSGTIVFLGNHKAKMTFLSKIYLIDLTTGKVIS